MGGDSDCNATECAPAAGRWLVSVEGPPVAARGAVVAFLRGHHRAEVPKSVCPLAALIAEFVAASTRSRRHVVTSVPWARVAAEPTTVRALHADLARALSRRMGLDVAGHLAVVLDADPHEALERSFHASPEGWETRTLTAAADPAATDVSSWTTAFPTQIVQVKCPPYAADNPVCLRRLFKEVARAVSPYLT